MVVCKFFLQGSCRYGNSCKFEHQIGDSRQTHTSVLRQQNPPTSTNPSNVDTNTLVRSVSNDMQAAEKGGQWLLSCYAPFKEKSNFPGFEDKSFEEVRFGFYDAQKNGTVEQYKQQLLMAAQDVMGKVRALQNPSPELVNIITQIYNSPPRNSSFGSSPFGTAQSSQNPMFGGNNFYGNQPQQTTLSAGNNNPGLFGQSTNQQQQSLFGTANSNNIFAQANQSFLGKPQQQQQQQSSVFGGGGFANSSPNKSIFGGGFGQQSQKQPSVFGAAPFNAQTPTTFGASPFTTTPTQFEAQARMNTTVQSTASVTSSFTSQPFGITTQPNQTMLTTTSTSNSYGFGGQQPQQQHQNVSPFNQNQNLSPFGGQVQNQQQQNSPLFGGQNQNQQQASSAFDNQNRGQQSIFNVQNQSHHGGPPSTNSQPFASQPNSNFGMAASQNVQTAPGQTQNSFAHSSNIFGSNFSSSSGSTETVVNVRDESFYSKVEDLTEEEIKSFESESFEFGKIPEKPPPLHLCF